MKLSDYNLLDTETQACPYKYYSKLRDEAPIYKMPDTGFYLVTSYELCNEIIRQPELFASGVNPAALRPGGTPQAVIDVYEKNGWMPVASCSTSDAPVHTRVHHVLSKLFTAARVKEFTPAIEQITRTLIDDIKDETSIEFVHRFSHPLPMTVIANLLGVPHDNLAKFKQWSDAIVEPFSMMISAEREVECAELVVEMQHYFAELINSRRDGDGTDLISEIVNMDMGEFASLNMAELLTIVSIDLLASGNETTTSAISSGMLLLCENPNIADEIYNDRSLLKNFTEEILRLESPAQGMFRRVTEDTTIGGIELKKEDLLSLRFGAANRDEAQFPNASKIDLHRKSPAKHLALGIGKHHCIGAVLARQEITTAFEFLITNFKNFSLDSSHTECEYDPSFFGRNLLKLPICYERR